MKKTKKLIALLLTGILSLSLLAGCAGKPKPGKEAGENTPAPTGTEANEPALTYNGQDVSEPVELVMYYIGDKTEDEDLVLAEVNKILKDKINATLVLKNMSLSDYSTKYALTIAGGENIDLIYTSTWAFYQSEASKGAFAEITDQVLADYMPQHKAGQSEASWGQAKIGDKIYFVPCNMANVSANAILIRGDLREKYGLEPLKSLADLEAYYAAVAADPDSGVSFAYNASQNNDTSKNIELYAENDWVRIEGTLVNYISYKYSDQVSAEDLFWIYGTEEYLNYAKLMKKWADEGFWSRSAIANATDVKEAYLNGTSASFSQNLGTVGAVASEVEKNHPEWKPEIYDLNPEANRFFAAYTGDGVAVLANSQNQARAFMALDLLKFDKDLYYLVRHGIEGVHYKVVSDGIWAPGDDMSKNPFGNGFSWGLKNNIYEMNREDTFADQVNIADQWKLKAVEGPTAAFSFNDANVKNELASLQSVYTQYAPLLDLGLVEDVEKTLAEFNKQAEAAGLQKIMDEVKVQVAAYLESVK
ncbi:putative aldouronate transport system substrate-binding protein [Anaerotaenia torta]|uniref:ABC transporter substrate-binding protein n=1 Tax=Anaerotaenia torta TaxID=433293 RepID=UPI003D228A30